MGQIVLKIVFIGTASENARLRESVSTVQYNEEKKCARTLFFVENSYCIYISIENEVNLSHTLIYTYLLNMYKFYLGGSE
jgi:hypothetical protein